MKTYIKFSINALLLMLLFCSSALQAQVEFIGPTSVEANAIAKYRTPIAIQTNEPIQISGGEVIAEELIAPYQYEYTVQWGNPQNGRGYLELYGNLEGGGMGTISARVSILQDVDFTGPTTVEANTIATYRNIKEIQLYDQYTYVENGELISVNEVAQGFYDFKVRWGNPSSGRGYLRAEANVANEGEQTLGILVNVNVSTDFTLQGPTTANQYKPTRYQVTKAVTASKENWNITGGEIVFATDDFIEVVWVDRNGGKVNYTLAGITKTINVTVNAPLPNQGPFTIVGPDVVDADKEIQYGIENDLGILYPDVFVEKIIGGSLEYQEQEPIFYAKWPDTPYRTKGVIIATIDHEYTIYKEVTINVTPPFVRIDGEGDDKAELNERLSYFYNSNIPDISNIKWNVTNGSLITRSGNHILVDWNKIGTGTIKVTGTAPNGDVFTDEKIVAISMSKLGKPSLLGPVVTHINSTVKYEIKNAHDAVSSYQNVTWSIVGGQILEKNQYGAIVKWNHLVNGSHTISVAVNDVDGTSYNSNIKVTLENKNLDNYNNPPSSFSTNENYVTTKTFDEPIKNLSQANENNTIENITYFDILGRAKQEVAIKAGGNQEDIIHHMEYDGLGRQTKTYLRYASETSNKAFRVYAQDETKQFYNTSKYGHTKNPYTEIISENNPSPRLQKQFAPGDDWKSTKLDDHAVYSMQDVVRTRDNVKGFSVIYDANKNTSLQYHKTFVTGRIGIQKTKDVPLQKFITKNENWKSGDGKDNTIEEFKDYQGRVILKRTYNKKQPHDTYYVYDNYGSLVYVIPPKASDQIVKADGSIDATVLNELCYQYKYDSRYRMIEKKVPGKKDWDHMVYDQLDRLILTQDARQRRQVPKEWIFTKYDKFGRVAYTGILADNRDRENMQSFYDNSTAPLFEERVASPLNLAGTGFKLYYSNNAEPKNIYNLMTINYYDDYNFDLLGATNPGSVYNQPVTTNTKTLATGSKIRVLGTNKWITNVNYYDSKARFIYGHAYNEYLGTTNIISNKLDFTGKLLETTTSHKRFQAMPVVTKDKFTYDHMGRLLTQKQTINNQPEELIASNTYDELGILVKKIVGGKGSSLVNGYKNKVNVKVESNVITKTKNSIIWDAGLSTVKELTADGYVIFEATAVTGKSVVAGLSKEDINPGANTIDYAIYLVERNAGYEGIVKIMEKGNLKGNGKGGATGVTYTTGDVFKVERTGNTIFYKKNDVIFYTSKTPSTGVLVGDASFSKQGSSIKNFNVEDTGISSLQYGDIVNVEVSDNGEIKKKVIGEDWNAGLTTKKRITGDGAISFEAVQRNTAIIVGLATKNTSVSYQSINYAIYLVANGTVQVREKGTPRQIPEMSYKAGDVFKVERKGTTVSYLKNDTVFHISKTSSNGILRGDASFYHNHGKIKNFKITGELKEGLQTIDYTYNVRGWLQQINDPNEELGDDLFAFGINYNMINNGITPLYNGNISQTLWKTANDNIKRQYSYSYDALNRMIKGIDNTGKYNLSSVNYDKNGNILGLTRSGWQNGVSFANMDRLYYTYDQGNRLSKVVDTGNDTYGFKDGTNTGNDYVYDVNGNMTVDRNKGITNIRYNHLNLPTVVTINGKQIRYTYDATGTKLTKSANGVFTHYDGGYVYEGPELQFFKHSEGYVEPASTSSADFVYVYQYKDHIDNIRLSYSDTDKDGTVTKDEIREENNYYPFGLKHKGHNSIIRGKDHKYGFGGKEEQDELGLDWIDITARNYDPALGRWMNLDPLAELFSDISTYAYANNNPIFFIDEDGRAPQSNGDPITDGTVVQLSGFNSENLTDDIIENAARMGVQPTEDLRSAGVYGHDPMKTQELKKDATEGIYLYIKQRLNAVPGVLEHTAQFRDWALYDSFTVRVSPETASESKYIGSRSGSIGTNSEENKAKTDETGLKVVPPNAGAEYHNAKKEGGGKSDGLNLTTQNNKYAYNTKFKVKVKLSYKVNGYANGKAKTQTIEYYYGQKVTLDKNGDAKVSGKAKLFEGAMIRNTRTKEKELEEDKL